MVGPVLHEQPTALKQITAPVGALHLIPGSMGERRLRHCLRRRGAFGGPIAEAGAKAVDSELPCKAEAKNQRCQRGLTQPAADRSLTSTCDASAPGAGRSREQ